MNTANMAASAAASLSVAGVRPRKRRRHSSPTPLGGLRPNGGKYGPFTISARERSRLAWRQRVDAAARAWVKVQPGKQYHRRMVYRRTTLRDDMERHVQYVMGRWPRLPEDRERVADEMISALAAPRPWRSPRKPDPRRRYSRSHRRACQRCRLMGKWLRVAQYVARLDPADPYLARFRKFTRNPHGRSDR